MINGVKEIKLKSISVCVHWNAKSRSRSQNFVLVGKKSSMPTNLPSKAYLWLMAWKRTVYANYIGPSVMTDANSEGFPLCDERITENDRCVIKIIGIHWENKVKSISVCVHWSAKSRSPNFVLVEKNSSMLTDSPSLTYVSLIVCEKLS